MYVLGYVGGSQCSLVANSLVQYCPTSGNFVAAVYMLTIAVWLAVVPAAVLVAVHKVTGACFEEHSRDCASEAVPV